MLSLTPLRPNLFVTGPGPDGSGSKPGKEGWAHMPEKSGIDAVPCLDSSVNAADENRIAAEVVAMINLRIMGFSCWEARHGKRAPTPLRGTRK